MEDMRQTALFRFLLDHDVELAGRLAAARALAEGWLGFIVGTFPHYTSHSVLHSDEIVRQVSRILFTNPEDRREAPKPAMSMLSPMEAFIIGCAAYFHDAGMVCSEAEKQDILSSEPWRRWLGRGNNGARYDEIISEPCTNDRELLRQSLALRFLIAEYIRQRHHIRSGFVLRQELPVLDPVAGGDRILLDAIEKVCIGHGLSYAELYDEARYRDQTDIGGYTVSLRFCAIALRLGDLLDMSTARSCPLLLSAANPLPADSYAHWSKGQRITHFHSDCNEIQIEASCDTAEEHRLLHDWCKWIVDETEDASSLLRRSRRHADWLVPHASIDVENATIRIEPAHSAAYLFRDWQFHLDHQSVFDRLVKSVYSGRLSFLKELIQNAADATRARIALELRASGADVPANPWDWATDRRQAAPIRITLSTVEMVNRSSGAIEESWELAVEDLGIGMTEEIIQDYFLQVGRSYYSQRNFRDEYGFVPISRFGVGFLSVFAESDDVEVETRHIGAGGHDRALKIGLSGPRSYFLVSEGDRREAGTTIRVRLRERPADIFSFVRSAFPALEFPIFIVEPSASGGISGIGVEQGIIASSDLEHLGLHRQIAFPIDTQFGRGDITVAELVIDGVPDWTKEAHIQNVARVENPSLEPLELSPPRLSLHGLRLGAIDVAKRIRPVSVPQYAIHLDYRGEALTYGLSRETASGQEEVVRELGLREQFVNILDQHVESVTASGHARWTYKVQLSERFPFSWYFDDTDHAVRVWRDGSEAFLSVAEVRRIGAARIAHSQSRGYLVADGVRRGDKERLYAATHPGLWITSDDLSRSRGFLSQRLFSGALTIRAAHLDGDMGVIELLWSAPSGLPSSFVDIFVITTVPTGSPSGRIGLWIDRSYYLNVTDPLIVWYNVVVEGDSYPDEFREVADRIKATLPLALRLGSSRAAANRALQGWNHVVPPDLRSPKLLDGAVGRSLFS